MKVKELLDYLSTKEPGADLYFQLENGPWRIILSIRITISDITLVRKNHGRDEPLKISKIIDRLRCQDHKNVYFESELDSTGKIKVDSIKSFLV